MSDNNEPDFMESMGESIFSSTLTLLGVSSLGAALGGSALGYFSLLVRHSYRDRTGENDHYIQGIREALADRGHIEAGGSEPVPSDEIYQRLETFDALFTKLEEQQRRRRVLIALLTDPFDEKELAERTGNLKKGNDSIKEILIDFLALGIDANKFVTEEKSQEYLMADGAAFAKRIDAEAKKSRPCSNTSTTTMTVFFPGKRWAKTFLPRDRSTTRIPCGKTGPRRQCRRNRTRAPSGIRRRAFRPGIGAGKALSARSRVPARDIP